MTDVPRALAAVHYELYESDPLFLDPDEDPHELDREIRLEFADGSRRFVTFSDGEGGSTVVVSDASAFADDPPLTHDVSAAPLWAPLVGRTVTLERIRDGLVLRVAAGADDVFVCAREGEDWGARGLHVTGTSPAR